jgi:hypothetical protein
MLLQSSRSARAARARYHQRRHRRSAPNHALCEFTGVFFRLPHVLTLRQHPAMIRAVKAMKTAAKPQTTFLCLSSANNVYISTILEVRTGSSPGLTTKLNDIYKVKRAPGSLHGDSDQPRRVGPVWSAQSSTTPRSQRATTQLPGRLQPKHLQR